MVPALQYTPAAVGVPSGKAGVALQVTAAEGHWEPGHLEGTAALVSDTTADLRPSRRDDEARAHLAFRQDVDALARRVQKQVWVYGAVLVHEHSLVQITRTVLVQEHLRGIGAQTHHPTTPRSAFLTPVLGDPLDAPCFCSLPAPSKKQECGLSDREPGGSKNLGRLRGPRGPG